MIAEVTTRPPGSSLIRESIDESNVDNIQRGFLAEMAQPLLTISLTVVNGNVGLCLGIESGHKRSEAGYRGSDGERLEHHVEEGVATGRRKEAASQ